MIHYWLSHWIKWLQAGPHEQIEMKLKSEMNYMWPRRWEISPQQSHAIVRYTASSPTCQSTWCNLRKNWALFAGKWARSRREVWKGLFVLYCNVTWWGYNQFHWGTSRRLMLTFREGDNHLIFIYDQLTLPRPHQARTHCCTLSDPLCPNDRCYLHHLGQIASRSLQTILGKHRCDTWREGWKWARGEEESTPGQDWTADSHWK